MNDYLYNLVGRSFGLIEAVRPRPISHFEPMPGLIRTPFNPVDALKRPEDQTVLPEKPIRPSQDSPVDKETPRKRKRAATPGGHLLSGDVLSREAFEHARDPAGSEPNAFEAFAARRAKHAPQDTSSGSDPLRAAGDAEKKNPDRTKSLRPSGHLSQPLNQASPEPVSGVKPSSVEIPQKTVAPAEEPKGSARIIPPVANSPGPRVATFIEATSSPMPPEAENAARSREDPIQTRSVKTITVDARPGVRPHLKSLPSDHRRPSEKNISAPTVQVTIGRIEVRAVPVTAGVPSQKQRPEAPMSLETYLRTRMEDIR